MAADNLVNGKHYVIYVGSEDWSALYVDGRLDTAGDHYLIDERLQILLGIESIQSDAFMCGGNQYEDVAPTLEKLLAWEKANDEEEKAKTADALRAKAAELRAQADAIDAQV